MTLHSSHAALPLALVAGAMVLTVAACGQSTGQNGGQNGGQTPASSTPAGTGSAAAPTTAGSSATATTSASAGASPSSSPAAGSGCAAAGLKVRYADDVGGGGAGSVTGTLTFTNTGSSACTLTGFPGVAYVGGGNGTQVGQPATRTDGAVKARTLAPGASVKAALRRTQPGNYGDECQQTKVDGLRVYPPNATDAAFVALKTTGCKSTDAPLLQVGPVR